MNLSAIIRENGYASSSVATRSASSSRNSWLSSASVLSKNACGIALVDFPEMQTSNSQKFNTIEVVPYITSDLETLNSDKT